jgi:hypothetical protein
MLAPTRSTDPKQELPMTDKSAIDYWLAKDAYDAAERALAVARANLNDADRARKAEWDNLVAAAEALPEDSRRKVAAAQFCGVPRDC